MIALRADNKINGRRAAKDHIALRLCDATSNGNCYAAAGLRSRVFQHAHASELGKNLLLRLLPNMTGVEDNQICILHAARLRVTFRREHVRHTMGIVDVHLATKGFDVDFRSSPPDWGQIADPPYQYFRTMRWTSGQCTYRLCRFRNPQWL